MTLSRSVFTIAIILVFISLPVVAGVTACPTSSTGSALNSFPSGNIPTLGCGDVDLGFNNFTAGGTVYNGATGTTLTTGLADIYAPTGPSPSGNTQGTISDDFDVPGTSTWSVASGSGVHSDTSNIGYEATVLNGISGVTPPSSSGYIWAINSLGIGATYAADPAGDSIVIHEQICGGATSVTVGSGGCTAADSATITETITGGTNPTIAYSSSSLTGTVFTFNSSTGILTSSIGFTQIAINDSVVISRGTGDGTVTLTSYSNSFGQFAESPEPATFGLMGAALAGLGALRLRNRAAPRKS